jgi:hypothetical protein
MNGCCWKRGRELDIPGSFTAVDDVGEPNWTVSRPRQEPPFIEEAPTLD